MMVPATEPPCCKIQDLDAEYHANIKFLVMVHLMRQLPMAHCIEDLDDEDVSPEDQVWTFKDVLGYQGPLKKSPKDYQGSLYNVLLLWDDGSETYKPLDMVIKDEPVTLGAYACKHSLLNEPGWKKLYKFGIQAPRNDSDAYELDKKNGNTK
jgi:hypothetical protein